MTADTAEPDSIAVAALEPRRVTRREDLPPEPGWFVNPDNPRASRAYRLNVQDLTAFASVERSGEVRQVTRAHLIAWRIDLEQRG